MKVTITKIEMPTASNWGIVQINNLENTFSVLMFVTGNRC